MVAPAAAAIDSSAGEVVVVTVNAHQRDYDDARMRELTKGIVARTPAVPDAILVDEILSGGITSMRDQLNALLGRTYVVVGATTDVKVKMLLNTKTMKLTGTRTWADVCDSSRVYQVLTAKEIATGNPVAVAGVHFAPSFNDGGSDACKEANADEVRRQMAQYGSSGVVGDFNKRYSAQYYECNPDENGDPLPWYSEMTAPSTIDGRSYVDTVRKAHYGIDMASQWSWENAQSEQLCTGATGFRRSRIDYIFASDAMTSLDAGTDQGWGSAVADGSPGCEPAPQCRYSDHRFVWARLSLVATGGGGNLPPTASFTSSCSGLSCTFTDSSGDSDGIVTSWSWDFGDGATSSLQSPSHTYAAAGTYNVTLTVTDNGSSTGTTTKSVSVTAPRHKKG